MTAAIFAARALIAAAHDLHDIGATAAGEVIADEAERIEGMAGEVRVRKREVA